MNVNNLNTNEGKRIAIRAKLGVTYLNGQI